MTMDVSMVEEQRHSWVRLQGVLQAGHSVLPSFIRAFCLWRKPDKSYL